jgi:integral membrane protein (TIGR01906 family)
MGIIPRLATVVFVIALPVFLVTANIRFLSGEVRLYERGFREYDAEKATGIRLAELDRAAAEIIAYFENDAGTLRILVTEDGEEVSLFNARETEHMSDVKTLMRLVFRLNEISLAVVITYMAARYLWAREASIRMLAREALIAFGWAGAVLGGLAVVALMGFDALWTRFHEIAFRNDLWRLDPDTDHLIQMFPEAFWEETALFVAVMTLAEVLLIAGIAAAYLVVTRERALAVEPVAEGEYQPAVNS